MGRANLRLFMSFHAVDQRVGSGHCIEHQCTSSSISCLACFRCFFSILIHVTLSLYRPLFRVRSKTWQGARSPFVIMPSSGSLLVIESLVLIHGKACIEPCATRDPRRL